MRSADCPTHRAYSSTASSGHRETRYRPRPRAAVDVFVRVTVLLAPAALLAISLVGDHSLAWTTSPLHWPALHVLPLLALAPLLTPLFVPVLEPAGTR